ncbi:MAG: alkaline phosphatase family protein, partial [Hyphomicrobiales bacterium]|nr:alkaline phosphatase family protein [Hyphomicrobiales bacterium]
RGAHAVTETPPGLSGATWNNLNTGLTYVRHGRYYYSQLRPGTYRTELLTPRSLPVPPFWKLLSDAGRRVAVVDVPKTFPTAGLNGIQVVDWGNHDADILEGFLTWPPELRDTLDARFGPDPFDRRAFGSRGLPDMEALVTGLGANIERKTRFVLDLLDQEPWDLLFAAWDDTHWAGHYTWRQHDTRHPHHDPDLAARLGNPLSTIYAAADRCIGEILERVGDETAVFVLSSHGMDGNYRTRVTLEAILRRLDASRKGRGLAYRTLRRIWDNLPGQVHRPLAYFRESVRESVMEKDRARRRHFALPCNNDTGTIRLNVVGREPEGRVRPGAEYDALCDWLSETLLAVVDADTGEPMIDQVYRIADLTGGDIHHGLPDLAVRWHQGPPVRRIASPAIGEIEVAVEPWRSGEHTPRGFLLSVAPGVAPGPVGATVRTQDLAPTIGHILGVPMPGLDGAVIDEMVPRAG